MLRTSFIQATRGAARGVQLARAAAIGSTGAARLGLSGVRFSPSFSVSAIAARPISSSSNKKGITPDDKAPEPKPEPAEELVRTIIEMTENEYHNVANEYMERLLTHLEDLEERNDQVDVEYNGGVLTVTFGPEIGTYVINKQPPSRQIWLSSPISGPKRYDYVMLGEGQHEKQDTACGEWLYMRDNTTLAELLKAELGVDMGMPTGSYGEEE